MRFTELHKMEGVRVDREAGVIRGVKIIGTKSANNRTYPIDVLAKAAPLYENRPVNINHLRNTKEDRSVRDTFGVVKGVTVQPSGENAGLYGDVHYLKAHTMADHVLEAAERFPHVIGLSHDADGTGRRTNEGFLVESVERVNSVDLVTSPATNKSLFEDVDPMKLRTLKLSEMLGTLPADSHEKRLLTKLIEDGAMAGDTSASVGETASPEEAIKAAFRAELVKAFDDESLDLKATLARIKDILKAHEKVMDAMAGTKKDETTPSTPAGGEQDPAPTMESLLKQVGNLTEQVRQMTAETEVHGLLREAKKTVSTEVFADLVSLPTTAARKRMIESIGGATQASGNANGIPKPRTVGTSAATGGAGNECPSGEKLVESLTRPRGVMSLSR